MLLWTSYVLGMAGLVALIDQSAPEHVALHHLLPMFTPQWPGRQRSKQERPKLLCMRLPSIRVQRRSAPGRLLCSTWRAQGREREEISEAYLDRIEGLSSSDQTTIDRVERALALLTEDQKRQLYDLTLARSEEPSGTLAGSAPDVSASLSFTPDNSASAV